MLKFIYLSFFLFKNNSCFKFKLKLKINFNSNSKVN